MNYNKFISTTMAEYKKHYKMYLLFDANGSDDIKDEYFCRCWALDDLAMKLFPRKTKETSNRMSQIRIDLKEVS